jgi:pimeloyl-ACP methyl ester carboxylesterase
LARVRDHKSLNVIESGNGDECVVFLHGLGGTHRYWTCGPQPLEFSGRRTVLIDLLGFGDSPRPLRRYTVDRHLDALHGSLHDKKNMTLVGHSLGAVLAVAYAARYPGAVGRLFLIGLPYFGTERAAYAWFRRMPGGWIYTNMAATALACMVSRRLAGRWLPLLLRDIPRPIAEDLVKHNFMSSTTSLWEVLYRHDLLTDIDALAPHLPVHCVHGAIDDTAPVEGVRTLSERKSGWGIDILDGVDHHPWLRRESRCREIFAHLLLQS